MTLLYTYIHFYILFHYGLSQDIEYSSLCNTLCCSVTQSCPLFVTPWTAAHQASLSFTIFHSLLKLVSIESVMPSNCLILCHRLLLLSSVFPSIKFFSSGLTLRIRWPKYWSFSISPSNECLLGWVIL